MKYIFKKFKDLFQLIKKLEISRKNLKTNFVSYYKYNFNIHIIRKIKLKIQYRKIGFVSTNLETYAYCNRKCYFCFNHERFEQREKGIMQVQTWEKIIDELSEYKFCGRISPHFYGEPLLDKRLHELLIYARKKCPGAYIVITTNGDFLNEVLFKKFIQIKVDHFLITNYDDEDKIYLKQLAENYPAHITYRSYKDYKKTDRSGKIFKKNLDLEIPCLRPSGQLVINWKGEVLLCCMDYYATSAFGNINERSINDIWNSPKFVEYRNILKKGKRSSISLCKHCDDSGRIPW